MDDYLKAVKFKDIEDGAIQKSLEPSILNGLSPSEATTQKNSQKNFKSFLRVRNPTSAKYIHGRSSSSEFDQPPLLRKSEGKKKNLSRSFSSGSSLARKPSLRLKKSGRDKNTISRSIQSICEEPDENASLGGFQDGGPTVRELLSSHSKQVDLMPCLQKPVKKEQPLPTSSSSLFSKRSTIQQQRASMSVLSKSQKSLKPELKDQNMLLIDNYTSSRQTERNSRGDIHFVHQITTSQSNLNSLPFSKSRSSLASHKSNQQSSRRATLKQRSGSGVPASSRFKGGKRKSHSHTSQQIVSLQSQPSHRSSKESRRSHSRKKDCCKIKDQNVTTRLRVVAVGQGPPAPPPQRRHPTLKRRGRTPVMRGNQLDSTLKDFRGVRNSITPDESRVITDPDSEFQFMRNSSQENQQLIHQPRNIFSFNQTSQQFEFNQRDEIVNIEVEPKPQPNIYSSSQLGSSPLLQQQPRNQFYSRNELITTPDNHAQLPIHQLNSNSDLDNWDSIPHQQSYTANIVPCSPETEVQNRRVLESLVASIPHRAPSSAMQGLETVTENLHETHEQFGQTGEEQPSQIMEVNHSSATSQDNRLLQEQLQMQFNKRAHFHQRHVRNTKETGLSTGSFGGSKSFYTQPPEGHGAYQIIEGPIEEAGAQQETEMNQSREQITFQNSQEIQGFYSGQIQHPTNITSEDAVEGGEEMVGHYDYPSYDYLPERQEPGLPSQLRTIGNNRTTLTAQTADNTQTTKRQAFFRQSDLDDGEYAGHQPSRNEAGREGRQPQSQMQYRAEELPPSPKYPRPQTANSVYPPSGPAQVFFNEVPQKRSPSGEKKFGGDYGRLISGESMRLDVQRSASDTQKVEEHRGIKESLQLQESGKPTPSEDLLSSSKKLPPETLGKFRKLRDNLKNWFVVALEKKIRAQVKEIDLLKTTMNSQKEKMSLTISDQFKRIEELQDKMNLQQLGIQQMTVQHEEHLSAMKCEQSQERQLMSQQVQVLKGECQQIRGEVDQRMNEVLNKSLIKQYHNEERLLEDLEGTRHHYEGVLRSKDHELQSKEDEIKSKSDALRSKERELRERDSEIRQLKKDLEQTKTQVRLETKAHYKEKYGERVEQAKAKEKEDADRQQALVEVEHTRMTEKLNGQIDVLKDKYANAKKDLEQARKQARELASWNEREEKKLTAHIHALNLKLKSAKNEKLRALLDVKASVMSLKRELAETKQTAVKQKQTQDRQFFHFATKFQAAAGKHIDKVREDAMNETEERLMFVHREQLGQLVQENEELRQEVNRLTDENEKMRDDFSKKIKAVTSRHEKKLEKLKKSQEDAKQKAEAVRAKSHEKVEVYKSKMENYLAEIKLKYKSKEKQLQQSKQQEFKQLEYSLHRSKLVEELDRSIDLINSQYGTKSIYQSFPNPFLVRDTTESQLNPSDQVQSSLGVTNSYLYPTTSKTSTLYQPVVSAGRSSQMVESHTSKSMTHLPGSRGYMRQATGSKSQTKVHHRHQLQPQITGGNSTSFSPSAATPPYKKVYAKGVVIREGKPQRPHDRVASTMNNSYSGTPMNATRSKKAVEHPQLHNIILSDETAGDLQESPHQYLNAEIHPGYVHQEFQGSTTFEFNPGVNRREVVQAPEVQFISGYEEVNPYGEEHNN